MFSYYPDLADILGRMDLNFDNFIFIFRIPHFWIFRSPDFQNLVWAGPWARCQVGPWAAVRRDQADWPDQGSDWGLGETHLLGSKLAGKFVGLSLAALKVFVFLLCLSTMVTV